MQKPKNEDPSTVDDLQHEVEDMKDTLLGRHAAKLLDAIRARGFAQPEPPPAEVSQAEQAQITLEAWGVPSITAIHATHVPLEETSSLVAARVWQREVLANLASVQRGKAPPITTILFFGMQGRGKSLAAAWLMLQAERDPQKRRRNERAAMWCNADDYVRWTLGHRKEDADRVDHAELASFLVLDELGDETIGETRYAANRLVHLLKMRTEKLRPTVVTSNIAAARTREDSPARAVLRELGARYNAPAISRIVGQWRIVEATGEDLRKVRRQVHASPAAEGTRVWPKQ